MTTNEIIIEAIGWLSTILFLVSIVAPQRIHLHSLGIFTAVTTGVYAYAHGATAIWVKWLIAFFFMSICGIKYQKRRKHVNNPQQLSD